MATKTKRLRVLREAYATLPSVECRGLCWQSCSTIPIAPVEQLNIVEATGRPVSTLEVPGLDGGERTLLLASTSDDECPYLQLKRCSIHDDRPLICRLFGVAQGLPCPHGCQPTSIIADRDVQQLLQRLVKL